MQFPSHSCNRSVSCSVQLWRLAGRSGRQTWRRSQTPESRQLSVVAPACKEQFKQSRTELCCARCDPASRSVDSSVLVAGPDRPIRQVSPTLAIGSVVEQSLSVPNPRPSSSAARSDRSAHRAAGIVCAAVSLRAGLLLWLRQFTTVADCVGQRESPGQTSSRPGLPSLPRVRLPAANFDLQRVASRKALRRWQGNHFYWNVRL